MQPYRFLQTQFSCITCFIKFKFLVSLINSPPSTLTLRKSSQQPPHKIPPREPPKTPTFSLAIAKNSDFLEVQFSKRHRTFSLLLHRLSKELVEYRLTIESSLISCFNRRPEFYLFNIWVVHSGKA